MVKMLKSGTLLQIKNPPTPDYCDHGAKKARKIVSDRKFRMYMVSGNTTPEESANGGHFYF